MLDLRFIRENAELVKANCLERRVSADPVDELVALSAKKANLVTKQQDLQRQQNEVAGKMKSAKSKEERDPLIQQGKQLKEEVGALEKEIGDLDEPISLLHRRIPNLSHPDAPRGETDAVVREVGQKPAFTFKPLDHVTICENLRLADFESASRVAGSQFYFMTGEGALLELALIHYAMNKLAKRGFQP